MNGLYTQIIDITDFGPYVTKLILSLPQAADTAALRARSFTAHVDIRDRYGDIIRLPKSFLERDVLVPSQGEREITDIYACDRDGRAADGESRFAALELAYGPIYRCASAIAADFSNANGHERYTVCDYTVTMTGPDGDMVFDRCAGVCNPKRERFTTGVSNYAPLPLRYGYYLPDLNGGKKALIVWLHGAGEGGDDTAIAYTGNKVTELTEPWAQKKFGGAFVFAPQCPTMWMDDGSGQYGSSGLSMYTGALKAAIDGFIDRFEDVIDRDRVYVGGDSNGGFMTMRLLMDYPDFFAAAFPICEAMLDARIADADIDHLKEIPIWFTHAKNDPVVVPDKYVLPTYERLIAAGAKNVHFTFWDRIVDLHAGFKDEAGQPFEYMGHFAWIPMLNDDCRLDFDGKPVVYEGREVTLLDWLAGQKK